MSQQLGTGAYCSASRGSTVTDKRYKCSPYLGSRAFDVAFPLKLFVSTVISATDTSDARAPFPDATVLLMIAWDRSYSFRTAFAVGDQSALRSYRCSIHCIFLRSLKVILPGLRSSMMRR
jgi:hypothetical protein